MSEKEKCVKYFQERMVVTMIYVHGQKKMLSKRVKTLSGWSTEIYDLDIFSINLRVVNTFISLYLCLFLICIFFMYTDTQKRLRPTHIMYIIFRTRLTIQNYVSKTCSRARATVNSINKNLQILNIKNKNKALKKYETTFIFTVVKEAIKHVMRKTGIKKTMKQKI